MWYSAKYIHTQLSILPSLLTSSEIQDQCYYLQLAKCTNKFVVELLPPPPHPLKHITIDTYWRNKKKNVNLRGGCQVIHWKLRDVYEARGSIDHIQFAEYWQNLLLVIALRITNAVHVPIVSFDARKYVNNDRYLFWCWKVKPYSPLPSVTVDRWSCQKYASVCYFLSVFFFLQNKFFKMFDIWLNMGIFVAPYLMF